MAPIPTSALSPSKNPVLLVHGIGDTHRVFEPMTAYLSDRGWSVHTLDLVPNRGEVGLDQLALQVRDYVTAYLAEQPFDLLGFSMGGIVSRYYLQRLGGLQPVQRFITLSSPHNGTLTAYARNRPGVKQMRPGSDLLQDLNRTLTDLEQVQFTSLWTPYDLMILPAHSSRLPVGQMGTIPALAHPLMLRDRRSLEAVATTLSTPLSTKVEA
ncbi:MAG: triacylglycerol lipase [Cyanobacteria bacterium]|nr:triacylglycerol lipase [Cyanobacteriota bacterium]MDA0866468.1 triacylglycerol lipase [Cyanobacteriota bacterium]